MLPAAERTQLFNQLRHVHHIRPYLIEEIRSARETTDMSSDLTQIARAQGKIAFCQRMLAEVEVAESAAKSS
jgi:transcription elongation GreA/GreB family factor